jgi:hypothetical protein
MSLYITWKIISHIKFISLSIIIVVEDVRDFYRFISSFYLESINLDGFQDNNYGINFFKDWFMHFIPDINSCSSRMIRKFCFIPKKISKNGKRLLRNFGGFKKCHNRWN